MTSSELNPRNYKRICIINWILALPLVILFGWPYLFMAEFFEVHINLAYTGALMFALPFTLTILHGHVTMALGTAHRHHYYRWLEEHTLTYGLFFHPVFTRTRFRLILVVISIAVIIVGWLIHF